MLMDFDLDVLPALLVAVHVYVPESLIDNPFMFNCPSVPVFSFKSLLRPILLHVNDGDGSPEALQVKVRVLPTVDTPL